MTDIFFILYILSSISLEISTLFSAVAKLTTIMNFKGKRMLQFKVSQEGHETRFRK